MDWAFFKKDLQYIFLNQIVSSIPSWTIRNFFYKCSGMKIGPKARIGINTVIISPKGITIGCRSVINDHIASFLSGAFAGISNYESENAKCKYDLHTVISELDAYGKDYFIIFAHVEQKSGLLSECSGGLLQSLVSQIPNFRDRVLGIQKMRTRDKINNLNQWLGYLPSFVEGSDPKQISEIGKGDHVYIKIGALTYAAVKFALQDSQNRVFTNLPSYHHGYIESKTLSIY